MNEHSSKKILFNKSTLFSLKAELLRKQEEVNEKKQLPKHKLENFKLPSVATSRKQDSKREQKKTFKDCLTAVDTEELEACHKSKVILEKKAELYEHLLDKAGNSQLAGRFLVDFDSKKKEVSKEKEGNVEIENVEPEVFNDESEWTEFTDCLGRTRKCHKSDLDMFMKRDKELLKVMMKNNSSYEELTAEDSNTPAKEKPLLVQTTNDYLQSLREKWEKKEQDLLAKDADIHYQDLLFDEARIHGVGYYSFSTDESERRKQMEELIKRREETLRAQQDAEIIRKKRDEMMAARVAAARARQRARAGLPPEEPKDPNEKDFNTCLLEFLTQQKNEVDAKAKEEERKIKEENEKERQKLREAYVREWDIGKEGIEDNVKKFKEMTQEEYVEQQRSKRINEFAPLKTSTSNNTNVFDSYGRIIDDDNVTSTGPASKIPPPPHIGDLSETSRQNVQKTWADVRPKVKTPPPPDIGDLTELTQSKGLYFSSVKNDNKVKYRNFVKAQESVPIINELNESYSEPNKSRETDLHGTEVAPPPSYEYYGPVPKKAKYQKPFESDIREAYAQGAKSLETKSGNHKLSQHYDFTFD